MLNIFCFQRKDQTSPGGKVQKVQNNVCQVVRTSCQPMIMRFNFACLDLPTWCWGPRGKEQNHVRTSTVYQCLPDIYLDPSLEA